MTTESILQDIQKLIAERDSLRSENIQLRTLLQQHNIPHPDDNSANPTETETVSAPIKLSFDKSNWQEDATAFLKVCTAQNIPAALERSQSGNGAHVWIFFETTIPVSLARKLGCGLLTLTMQHRHQISLQSYDRLFPNQDTMPKGGFGNLIAFPLQGKRREQGNSVFIDENLKPYPDQWDFLANLRKMTFGEVDSLVAQLTKTNQILDIHIDTDEEQHPPWEKSKTKESEKILIIEPHYLLQY